jgi:hypothetical protein
MEQEGRMNVVVRMNMPSNDKTCGMVFDYDGIWYCPIEQRVCHQPDNGGILPSWCPIICSLPEGHGRLVDVAVLKNKNMRKPRGVSSYDYGAMATVFMDIINDTPTIVPAETERSET